jgi:hypothetical protein
METARREPADCTKKKKEETMMNLYAIQCQGHPLILIRATTEFMARNAFEKDWACEITPYICDQVHSVSALLAMLPADQCQVIEDIGS